MCKIVQAGRDGDRFLICHWLNVDREGDALAATTPHEFLQAGVFEHLQTPVVQAAIERFREFFGIGNLPMATREDIDAWQQSLMETYQKNVMKMHPSLANL